jgi:putative flippase GtrA
MLQLIHDIKTNGNYQIIIVNDGSPEKCKSVFKEAAELGCTVLHHKTNQGKGAALKTAFRYLINTNETDGFICADCDGQHKWSDIKKIAESIPFNPDSIILGSRKFVGQVPLKSMFGNKITRAIFSMITGQKISDTQTGLRGFSAAMLPWLVQLDGNRYEYEMNQLLEAKKAGFGFHCIPIETIYENNNEGSHFNPILDSIRVFLPIIKFSMSSISSGLIDFAFLFLLQSVFDNLLIAVVGSRIISSMCNYMINQHFVFQAKSKNKVSSLVQYYLLVVVILGFNYLLISFFSEGLQLPLLLSKILTEGLLFCLSYTVQNKFIFRKKKAQVLLK